MEKQHQWASARAHPKVNTIPTLAPAQLPRSWAPDILTLPAQPASEQRCLAPSFGNRGCRFQEGSWGELGLSLGTDCVWNIWIIVFNREEIHPNEKTSQ